MPETVHLISLMETIRLAFTYQTAISLTEKTLPKHPLNRKFSAVS